MTKNDGNGKLVVGNSRSALQIRMDSFYERLYSKYGNTGWWPADSRDEVIIGAILTQNTSWKNVEISLDKMREKGVLSLLAISSADQALLRETIRSSGFYNQKSERLMEISRSIVNTYGNVGKMMEADIYGITTFLSQLKGVGQETLDSILLYALDRPVFVVDKYTIRILSRIGIQGIDGIDSIKKMVHEHLGNDVEKLKNLHGMIVYLGKDFCKAKPECSGCPVKDVCDFGINLSRSHG